MDIMQFSGCRPLSSGPHPPSRAAQDENGDGARVYVGLGSGLTWNLINVGLGSGLSWTSASPQGNLAYVGLGPGYKLHRAFFSQGSIPSHVV